MRFADNWVYYLNFHPYMILKFIFPGEAPTTILCWTFEKRIIYGFDRTFSFNRVSARQFLLNLSFLPRCYFFFVFRLSRFFNFNFTRLCFILISQNIKSVFHFFQLLNQVIKLLLVSLSLCQQLILKLNILIDQLAEECF